MDRVTQLREPGGSSSLNSSAASEGYTTANESSKYFSIDTDSSLDVTPTKDAGVADHEKTLAPDLISSLSPISKKGFDYKIGDKIEAANILSGGVDIFDDNENSYDEDSLVIDDNAVSLDDKSSAGIKSPDNSNLTGPKSDDVLEDTITPSKDTEVVLQIDGKNVDAIDIGNGLYLYRKEGEEELAAVQIVDDQPQPTFKFLKVRENAEGNLEVYEEIEVEVPKETTTNESKPGEGSVSHVPIRDIEKIMSENTNKSCENVKAKKHETLDNTIMNSENTNDQPESKIEINFSGKIKFSELRKSPVIGSFTPMTFHSTPKKEGIPLTKTMVDQQLQPTNRHSDNIKKTIEVHTDSIKQKNLDTPVKDMFDDKALVFTSSSTEICDSNHEKESCVSKTNINTKVDTPFTTSTDPRLTHNSEDDKKAQQNQTKQDPPSFGENQQLNNIENIIESQAQNAVGNTDINTLKIQTSGSTEKSNESQISIAENNKQTNTKSNNENTIDKSKTQSDKETRLYTASIAEEKKTFTEDQLFTTVDLLSAESKKQDNSNLKKSMGNVSDVQKQTSNKNIETKKIEVTKLESKSNICEKQTPKLSLPPSTQTEDINTKSKMLNNHTAVPFGKWTEANKQDFLKKIKEAKVPTNTANTNQIKHSNDLNRRDVLQKIDRKRLLTNLAQQNITLEVKTNLSKATTSLQRNMIPDTKNETKNPPVVKPLNQDINISVIPPSKQNPVSNVHDSFQVLNPKNTYINKKMPKPNSIQQLPTTPVSLDNDTAKPQHRTGFNNQVLIDRTIEDLLHRADVRPPEPETKQQVIQKDEAKEDKQNQSQKLPALDAIEKKMNELHGIPFVERPPHELPQRYNHDLKSYKISDSTKGPTKSTVPNLLPIPSNKVIKGIVEIESEEEIIEHEPVTGDADLPDRVGHMKFSNTTSLSCNTIDAIKDKEVRTEKEFDKFSRTKSLAHGNSVLAKYEKPDHNVVKSVDKKEGTVFSKSRLPQPLQTSSSQKSASSAFYDKLFSTSKLMQSESSYKKNVQSKLQVAYQSAVTAKIEKPPVTILEDKPVKIVYMEPANNLKAFHLNTQGKHLLPYRPELSTVKKPPEVKHVTKQHEVLPPKKPLQPPATIIAPIIPKPSDVKLFEHKDDGKPKTKHVRKQELKPVETPELEIIEPSDFLVSSKKKRRVEDNNKSAEKNIVPKKSYLLGRDAAPPLPNVNPPIEQPQIISSNTSFNSSPHKTISAIDNLVKAAELLESQSIEKCNQDSVQTPPKRGRGRPRKYPVPENATPPQKTGSPQKRLRPIDSQSRKYASTEEESSSDDEMLKENWTMGKINENIVCPICNKLFRSENVVFKHVKHCTGPSPSRSDSDQRSSRRSTHSQESGSRSGDNKSSISDTEDLMNVSPKRVKLPSKVNDEVIVIEETPVKEKKEDVVQQNKYQPVAKIRQTSKPQFSAKNLACEYCGKTFRQYSYLISHKQLHKKEENKPVLKQQNPGFSCEVCKKEFRKPYHLAQHRMIHKPTSMQARSQRKSNPELNDNKTATKQEDDQSAGFRCEPCDKSFRKLHHLVEHRETHDGKHKASTFTQAPIEKLQMPPQCEVCKKTFRKLHHLIEHRQQHAESSSDKSDGKDAKSSLSTKDIIHECSLCYMVFPNEHALNKHSINCAKKKKQPLKGKEAESLKDKEAESLKDKEAESTNIFKVLKEPLEAETPSTIAIPTKSEETVKVKESKELNDIKVISSELVPSQNLTESQNQNKEEKSISDVSTTKQLNTQSVTKADTEIKLNIQENSKPSSVKVNSRLSSELPSDPHSKVTEKDSPRKRLITKTKSENESVTKRFKISDKTLQDVKELIAKDTSDDDDDIRYMINPNFETNVTKATFLKIRAQKRNSLQIERPNSKDLITRRTSLQQLSKVTKPKSRKSVDISEQLKSVTLPKSTSESETVPSDTDDTEVKYAFPDVNTKKDNPGQKDTVPKKKNVLEKRKTLTGIAKRKSLGKSSTPKPSSTKTGSPKKNISLKKDLKRRPQVEHICDCGKHFSSSVLLSHHITAAHTPPRIRLARPPPTQNQKKPPPKTTADTRKSSVKGETSNKQSDSRKSVNKSKTDGAMLKSAKKTPAHKGVPIPEGLRKRMEKIKK